MTIIKNVQQCVKNLIILSVLSFSFFSQAAINQNQLGANYSVNQQQINFRIFSANATKVELYLYDQATGVEEVAQYSLTKDNNDIWSTTLDVNALDPRLSNTIYYGYRVWGPNWPYNAAWEKGTNVGFISDVDAQGNRFNPNKLLSDPYAKELSHDHLTPQWNDGTIYASGPSYRNIDSGLQAPKGILLAADSQSIGIKPTRALKDDIIYEVNVRGLTKNDTSIPEQFRGTYQGAALKAQYLADLGISAVEFLPVQETQNETNDMVTSTDGDNYWGYMTLNYFAPDRRYASDKSAGGPTKEFKAMVKAFHDKGIKVFIDVVYNHTGEGGAWINGDSSTYNLYSWRGLDNSTYYSLTNDKQHSWDNTGVGGNYNTVNPIAQDLIIDSLEYWQTTLGVDGFRFDLASVLGNTCEHGCFNFDKMASNNALNRIINEFTERPTWGGQGSDFIAEPWAIGGNSYQVGGFPAGWSEWNGKYRDTLRKDQNLLGAEDTTLGELANIFTGSASLYQDDGRAPWNSVNFVVAHDGLTLKDLYSCNSSNNSQLWPYGPSDGGESNNHSWDQGWYNQAQEQRKAARNGFALLMLSAGTPMITGGDEYLRSIQCNNNPYNLDSIANWLNFDWSADQQNFNTFAKRMIEFRKNHPSLRPANFYQGIDTNSNYMEQLVWFQPDGNVASGQYFNDANNHAIAYRIDSSEFNEQTSAIYVAYNGWSGNVNFTLPWPGAGKNWYRVTDTSNWNEGENTVKPVGSEDFIGGEYTSYGLNGRAILVLIAK
ncbi:isoamylase [Psychrosphaera sp. B3R10]|uniref:isoamylase n=1 Tax=unclassified Psychrosphaera TaxID=2641570 RepID=UPI001C0960CE|nr:MULTISPECIES: isoamylase [unclassified Psychrosphaera]MBU2881984.1 isoamylase [Psychrosphaera sp. I2R16]MBU2988706.1 isoamylase [Psychrosphaera sp. B3R10]